MCLSIGHINICDSDSINFDLFFYNYKKEILSVWVCYLFAYFQFPILNRHWDNFKNDEFPSTKTRLDHDKRIVLSPDLNN